MSQLPTLESLFADFQKLAFQPAMPQGGGAPPGGDPAAMAAQGGGMPPGMDPAMAAQGGMPPGGMPPGMDPSMAAQGGMPPGGAPPGMDPAMAAQGGMPPGGAPPAAGTDPGMMGQIEEMFSGIAATMEQLTNTIQQQQGQQNELVKHAQEQAAKISEQDRRIAMLEQALGQLNGVPAGA